MTAPLREVTNIVEVTGERGGVQLVHVLECGHWVTRRKPRDRVGCTGCEIERQLANDPNVSTVGPRAIALRAVEAALTGALGEILRQGGPDYLIQEARGEGLLAARPFLDALGAPPDGQGTATAEASGTDRRGQGSD